MRNYKLNGLSYQHIQLSHTPIHIYISYAIKLFQRENILSGKIKNYQNEFPYWFSFKRIMLYFPSLKGLLNTKAYYLRYVIHICGKIRLKYF